MISAYAELPPIFFESCLVLLRQALWILPPFSRFNQDPGGRSPSPSPFCKITRVALAEILSLDEPTHL
jgi:hypothetical protein